MMDVTKRLDEIIAADICNSIVFDYLKEAGVYLVGGYIRDTLLGKKPLDRDYAVRGSFTGVLGHISARTGGKLVRIGKGELYRIILRDGVTLDFSPAKGDIAADLSSRDFTINSMAWSPLIGLVDLHNGVQDLSDRIIRVTNEDNIRKDPVRILRAFRFASEQDFEISRETREAVRCLRHMLGAAKNERITLEFFKILCSEDVAKPLSMMLIDDILGEIISRPNKELSDKIDVICQVRSKLDKLPLKYSFKILDKVSQNLSLRGLYYLEVLLSGHPRNLLTLSSKIRRRISGIDKARKVTTAVGPVGRYDLFEVFETAGESSLDYLIIGNFTEFIEDLERYQEILKNPILTADDIREITGIGEGILMGRAITALRKAHFLGKIQTRNDAAVYVKRIIGYSNLT